MDEYFEEQLEAASTGSDSLVGWVMERVNRWRNHRDNNYLPDWEKYYNIWRGKWSANLKDKEHERSRLISPATQNAVDTMVAEMAEATFGRGKWFDIQDTDDPQQRATAEVARDNLIADFDRDGIPSVIRECYFSGAIYGNGIAKRTVEDRPDGSVAVKWIPVLPFNFVIDTAATNVEDDLGCADETIVPLHYVEAKQINGEFLPNAVGAMAGYESNAVQSSPRNLNLLADASDGVYITEYHGKVPAKLFNEATEKEADLLAGLELGEDAEKADELPDEMIEAVITIANGGILLKKVEAPFGDRGVVAYAHDKVTRQFWGRGIAEKTFNSQSALDAHLRARIDALGLMTYPVMGADATRLPRNLNLQIRPGKTIFTNGRPSEIVEPITFGNLDISTFQHTADLERYVQMASGSYEAATPTNVNTRNETSSGVSMSIGSMVKRAKLTMFNVDQDFLDPIIRKSISAYSQVDPQRYPVPDASFTVNSTMSVMAREFEQTQMTNLLAIMPQESPAFLLVLKAIVENYSGPSKDALVQSIESMMQPDPEQQQMDQTIKALQLAGAKAEVQKLQAEVNKIMEDIKLIRAKAMKEQVLASLADDEVEIDAARVALENRQTKVQEAQAALKNKELDIRNKEVSIKAREGANGKSDNRAKPKS